MKHMKIYSVGVIILLSLLGITNVANAQGNRFRAPVTSPEVNEDRSITFRIFAPEADTVRLSSSDLPGFMAGKLMERSDEGVWETTVGPFVPGSYRYNFNLDGVSVIDPRNPYTSRSNANTWSLVDVSGDEMMDTRKVPHGAVSEVTYYSETLGKHRTMHIYTPPGYESGEGEFPVFYLLHGASDSDDSWSTVGRAGFIVDNLIAENKAEPMVIVMPNGHTGIFSWGGGGLNMNEFVDDFNNDIKPFVEENYRINKDRESTAMAGLSMGGAHTLSIAIPNLEEYAYIGVFSSGVFGINGPSAEPHEFVTNNREIMNDDELKEGLELMWFATGKDDFLIETSRATVDMFKERGFDVIYEESEGGHTWLNWRNYLIEFTPMLFK
jgi:enterochelin esterase family protein